MKKIVVDNFEYECSFGKFFFDGVTLYVEDSGPEADEFNQDKHEYSFLDDEIARLENNSVCLFLGRKLKLSDKNIRGILSYTKLKAKELDQVLEAKYTPADSKNYFILDLLGKEFRERGYCRKLLNEKIERIYFAHPVSDYDTQKELDQLQLIQNQFPDNTILNPNAPEHILGYEKRGMAYFEDLVRTCDILVAASFDDGEIGMGVWREMEVLGQLDKPLFLISGSKIESVDYRELRPLSISETRKRVREIWIGGKMSLLDKLIRDGWFKRPEDFEPRTVSLDEITQEQLRELVEKKSTIIYDSVKVPYIVKIPYYSDINNLEMEDIQIRKLSFSC